MAILDSVAAQLLFVLRHHKARLSEPGLYARIITNFHLFRKRETNDISANNPSPTARQLSAGVMVAKRTYARTDWWRMGKALTWAFNILHLTFYIFL